MAELKEKDQTYGVWENINSKNIKLVTLYLDKFLNPSCNWKFKLIFTYRTPKKVNSITLYNKKGEVITVVEKKVLDHYLKLQRLDLESFNLKKSEIISNKASIRTIKHFMVECVRYL